MPTTHNLRHWRIGPYLSRALVVVIYGLPVLAAIGAAEAVKREWSIADGALAARWLFILGSAALVFIATESLAHRAFLLAHRGRPGGSDANGLGSTGASAAVAAVCVVLLVVTQGAGSPGNPLHHLVAKGSGHPDHASGSPEDGAPSSIAPGTVASAVPLSGKASSSSALGRLTSGSASTAATSEATNSNGPLLTGQPDTGSSGGGSSGGGSSGTTGGPGPVTAPPPSSPPPSGTPGGAPTTVSVTTPPVPVVTTGDSPPVPPIDITTPAITVTVAAGPAGAGVTTTSGAPLPVITAPPLDLNALGITASPAVPSAVGANATVTASEPVFPVSATVETSTPVGSVSVAPASDATDGGTVDAVVTAVAAAPAVVTDPSEISTATDPAQISDSLSITAAPAVATVAI